MIPKNPATKAAVVVGGFVFAAVGAWLAVEIHDRLTQGTDAQASAGMFAFGDLVLGVAVFSALSLVPFTLAVLWLLPVVRSKLKLTSGNR